MERKHLVILANSIKRGGRCIAGKEVVAKDGDWTVRRWCRPVANDEGGAIIESQVRCDAGRLPHILEIVEVPLSHPVPLPGQPENWRLADGDWRSVGFWPWEKMQRLLDWPVNLWDDDGGSRSVSDAYARAMPLPASLYLIRPTSLQVSLWTEPNPFPPPATKRHRRARVGYSGMIHELDVTDPVLQAEYFPEFPAMNQPAVSVPLRNPTSTFLTVSLTPEWQGRHYKIAAAFIEPPRHGV